MRTPAAGTSFPTVLARCALVAAALGFLPATGSALERMPPPAPARLLAPAAVLLPPTSAPPANRCQPGAGPSTEPAAIALARSAMQAGFRPVYWNSFQVPDSLIKSRLDDLASRAPTFAAALDRMRETHFFTLIATAEQADIILGLDCLVGPIASGVLSDAGYMAGSADGDIVGAFVRIDIDAIRTIASRRVRMARMDTQDADCPAARIDNLVRTRDAIDAALAEIIDDVLIHEVWGHLVPVAELRHDSGRCPDPEPDQDPVASCVIRRVNWLRAELGLMPTPHYGIPDVEIGPAPATLSTATPGAGSLR